MKKFAVIGNPVEHSLSPVIHRQFAQQFKIPLEYTKIHAQKDEFNQRVGEFFDNGGCGLNVTVPFKTDAFELSVQHSQSAVQAKAVNTLSYTGRRIIGDNTDGIGLVRDLEQNHQFWLKGKRILILGAGGAASGIIGPMLERQTAMIVVANRTEKKAVELANSFSHVGSVQGVGLGQLPVNEFDLILNATAASLDDKVPDIPSSVLNNVLLAYDLMYASKPTRFMVWARDNGVKRATDGLGMLVEQAAEAFAIWHGQRPQTAGVLNDLTTAMK